MPSCRSPAISPSCAAPRIRRSWCCAAKALGLGAIAITDRNTLAGVVRAHSAAKELGMRAHRRLPARSRGRRRACCATRPTAPPMAGSCRLLTAASGAREKGECRSRLCRSRRASAKARSLIALPPERPRTGFADFLERARRAISPAAPISPRQHLYRGDDAQAPASPGRARGARAACRWSPPTTCSITRPSGGGCRMC